MDRKFILIAMFVLMFSTFVLSAPSIVAINPSSQTSGTTLTLDFNIVDENAEANRVPDTLIIAYSTSAGSFSNTIYTDTNLLDSTGVQCADTNFFLTTRCTYDWTIPNVTPFNYFVDFNFIVEPESVGYTDSSTGFLIENTQGCATFNWVVLVIALSMCAFTLLKFLNDTNPTTMTMFAVSVIVGLAIIYTFATSICVVTG